MQNVNTLADSDYIHQLVLTVQRTYASLFSSTTLIYCTIIM